MFLIAALCILHLAATKGDLKSDAAKDQPAKPSVSADQTAKAGSTKDHFDLPVPRNEPQKGLRIPVYDSNQKLKMNFQIGIATWIDDDHIKMAGLRIETFKDDGSSELEIDLPDSLYNTKSREVSAENKVLIKREDFELTGEKMIFDTEKKVGKLRGGVRMLVYNLQADGASPAPEPAQPAAQAAASNPAKAKDEKK